MKQNILSEELGNAVDLICTHLMETKGTQETIHHCDTIGLNYGYCKGCEVENPIIETYENCTCALCGTEVARPVEDAKYTEYQLFLFGQLLYANLEGCEIADLAYDIIFPVIKHELGMFLGGLFDVDTQSEYDCMNEYLAANIDRISITLADHSNI